MPEREPPSLAEFLHAGRTAFAFLAEYGFVERRPPPHREGAFQLWFEAGDRIVILKGEGYGATASITFETTDGRGASLAYFVPAAAPRSRRESVGQLHAIRSLAGEVEAHATDFLSGDLQRYNRIAREQPPWKHPP